MPISTSIRIKIVLLMAKFESPVLVRQTLQTKFEQDTSSEDTVRRAFQRFYETGTVKDRQRSGRPSTIAEKKGDEVRDVYATESNSRVRDVTTACSIPQTTLYRIMTGYSHIRPTSSNKFTIKICTTE